MKLWKMRAAEDGAVPTSVVGVEVDARTFEEALGKCDSEGVKVYRGEHFEDERGAWDRLVLNAGDYVELGGRRVREARSRLRADEKTAASYAEGYERARRAYRERWGGGSS